ncbi:MAG: sulfotransferase family protein [Kiritimatiellia bacterium]
MKEKQIGKIIGVGFQKTGTSTLRDALRILGYRVKDCTPRPLISILKGDFQNVVTMLDGYDAVEDTPWYMIYKELDGLIPHSKFILTLRDPESWFRSVSRHIGDLRSPHHEWIYGKGKGLPKYHKRNAIRVYSTHNQEVLDYFKDRPDDLLVLDFTKGDRWEPLCGFLDHSVPDAPFPHANETRAAKQSPIALYRKWRYLRKQTRNHVKMKYMEARGYL